MLVLYLLIIVAVIFGIAFWYIRRKKKKNKSDSAVETWIPHWEIESEEINEESENENDESLLEQEMLLLEYLEYIFGKSFLKLIKIPENYKIGERVIYKLAKNKTANRHEISQKEQKEQKDFFNKIAEEIGAPESIIDPPVSSGLPYPRLVDIPGWDIIFDIPLKRYLQSNDISPSDDFNIEWLIGVFFGHSKKILAYIDFVNPKVKGIFSETYEEEYDLSNRGKIVNKHFAVFIKKLTKMKNEIKKPHFSNRWVKVIHYESDLMVFSKKEAD